MGLDKFKVTLALEELFQYFGEDHSTDSEPYMWIFMFKIDGETITQNGNLLSGKPVYFYNTGSHGNLLGGESNPNGAHIDIPPAMGRWTTTMQPINVTIPVLIDFDEHGAPVYFNAPVGIPGIIGCVAVLFEENETSDEAMENGHNALINLLKEQLEKMVEKIDLEILGYKVQKLVRDGNMSIPDAARSVLNDLTAETQSNITEFAAPVVTYAILQKMNILGAISPDVFLGQAMHIYDQERLSRAGNTYDWERIKFIDHLFDNPNCPEAGDWAYTLHGVVYPHIQYVAIPYGIPDTPRVEVSCIRRSSSESGYTYVSEVGGVYNDMPWLAKRETVMNAITNNGQEFFTRRKDGAETKIIVNYSTEIGHSFLQTVANDTTDDNLLSQANCPISMLVVEE